MSKCPDCGNELRILVNNRMDFITEEIPFCDKCQVAFRDPDLGWKIIEDETKKDR